VAQWNLGRDGFTVIERLLEADELPLLRAEIERVLAGPLPPGCERPHNTLAPLAWGDPVVERVLGRRERRDVLAAALEADDLRWISGYVSVKEPRSEALEWHQDWWCWDHPVSFRPRPAQVAVLLYLSDTSPRSAALRVEPGTHHGAATHAPTTLAVHAGDAVACDYRLLHGTHPNATEARRDCLILNFAPSWSSLPDDIRAHLIRHPALPPAGVDELLPDYDGEPRDLPLNRGVPNL
jgi:Phytanoyl-CoA dioxygenase (PhyH)